MKQILLLLVVPFAFFTALPAQAAQELTPVLIQQGRLHGAGREGIDAQFLVIKNQTDWDSLKTSMNSYEIRDAEVDFSDYQVIAVFDEVRPYGCYGIEITNVTEYADNIEVTVKYDFPDSGVLCPAVIVQPYYIIKIQVSDKPISFNVDEEEPQLTPILIKKGNLYGAGREGIDAQFLVIKNQTDWDSLKTSMNSYEIRDAEVDFSYYQVIAVFDEVRPYGCYGIEITNVTEYADNIEVTVKYDFPDPGVLCPAVIVQPYYIIKIPVSDKVVRFNQSDVIEDLRQLTDLSGTKSSTQQLYPNPVDEWLTIPCSGVSAYVEIYDLKGNSLFSGRVFPDKACQLNVSFLNAGIYIVNVSGKTYKMIKK